MTRLLHADFYRLFRQKTLWLCVLLMMLLAVGFCIMQKTAMDYTVSLDRVIFLPMSLYGVAAAALVSLFTGEDLSSGVIRNKLIAGRTRPSIYLSLLLSSWAACLTVYLLTIAVSLGLGLLLFPVNVTAGQVAFFLLLGTLTCLGFGSLYCAITLLAADRSAAVAVCMGLALVLLFLCLQTNSLLVQTEYRDGLPNPHYVGGLRRTACAVLHDLNPFGQAAQLSAMECLSPPRFAAMAAALIIGSGAAGLAGFCRKDLK